MIPFEPSLNNPRGKTLADLLIVIFIPFSETLDIEFGEHNKWRNMLCGFELGFTPRLKISLHSKIALVKGSYKNCRLNSINDDVYIYGY